MAQTAHDVRFVQSAEACGMEKNQVIKVLSAFYHTESSSFRYYDAALELLRRNKIEMPELDAPPPELGGGRGPAAPETDAPTREREREPSDAARLEAAAPRREHGGAARKDVVVKDLIEHGYLVPGERPRPAVGARTLHARAHVCQCHPPSRARGSPARARARAAPPNAPGENVLRVRHRIQGLSIDCKGHLLADGTLVDADEGTAHGTPSGWATACIRRAGFDGKGNGWLVVWYDKEGELVQLMALRQKLEDLRKASGRR